MRLFAGATRPAADAGDPVSTTAQPAASVTVAATIATACPRLNLKYLNVPPGVSPRHTL
jgi:hypothetical protein